jgi:DNA-binding NarL/FixJ family response regulator
MLKMIIADDHSVVRQSLVQFLEEEFSPVKIGEAFDAPSLVELAMQDDWHLIISDLAMPGGGGLEALRFIREKDNHIPFIIISTYPREQYEVRVIKAGAQAFVSKDDLPHALIQLIRQFRDNHSF